MSARKTAESGPLTEPTSSTPTTSADPRGAAAPRTPTPKPGTQPGTGVILGGAAATHDPHAPVKEDPPGRARAATGEYTMPPDRHRDLHGKELAVLAVGALGIVFGDIGTSPLYTLKECMHEALDGLTGAARVAALHDDVLGVLSLIFWALTMVVTVKYLSFIMRADNKGEGGIFALLALVPVLKRKPGSMVALLVVAGAALLYGDGVITPAISVLSAVEGVGIASPALSKVMIWGMPLPVPITILILIGLFALQRTGTHTIGRLFGPVMCVWFATLAGLGILHIAHAPEVLWALSPHEGFMYFQRHGIHGALILGSVVLAVTGGEALYADMGHFGLRPIRLSWLAFVMPSLLLCYFGQGALLLHDATALENPFFNMVPEGAPTYALVVLSSLATIIASQALISGAFSLTRQAMQLGYFPRMTITHTTEEHEGQIYIPEMNTMLAVGCVLLVLGFRESGKLASAYGIAVTGTMAITSIVYYTVLRETRGWSRAKALPLLVLFLVFDIPFLVANLFKILDGGAVPVLVAMGVIAVMLVWQRGRSLIMAQYSSRYPDFEEARVLVQSKAAARVPGTAVFLSSTDKGMPPILVHHVERTRALHKQVLLLTVVTEDVPFVPTANRLQVMPLGHGFFRVFLNVGFMQQPNVPRALRLAVIRKEIDLELDEVTYFLARENIVASKEGNMGQLAETLFAYLQRNAVVADRHFRIPHMQVVEIGAQLDL